MIVMVLYERFLLDSDVSALQVLYKAGKGGEWYNGSIIEHYPDAKIEAFLIQFDDGDAEKGRIGLGTFLTLRSERPYQWLDEVDTARPGKQQGATEHSFEGSQHHLKALHNNAATAGSNEQKQPIVKR